MGYIFELVTKSHLKDICKLYSVSFNKKIPLLYFNQKYDTMHTKLWTIGYIAYEEDSKIPVAYYGLGEGGTSTILTWASVPVTGHH